MIHRNHQMFEFECDDCGETLDTSETEWTEAMRVMKNAGWVSRKNGNSWEHFCPQCEGFH